MQHSTLFLEKIFYSLVAIYSNQQNMVLPDELAGLVSGKHMRERVTAVTLVTLPKMLWKSKPPRGEPYEQLSKDTTQPKNVFLWRGLVNNALWTQCKDEEEHTICVNINHINAASTSTLALYPSWQANNQLQSWIVHILYDKHKVWHVEFLALAWILLKFCRLN